MSHTGSIILNYPTLSFWRKFFMDITLDISQVQICNWVWKPWKILLMNCNLLSQYWNRFLLLTSFPKVDIDSFSLLKNSYTNNLNIFPVISLILFSWKNFLTPRKNVLQKRKRNFSAVFDWTAKDIQSILTSNKKFFFSDINLSYLPHNDVYFITCKSKSNCHFFKFRKQFQMTALRLLFSKVFQVLSETPDDWEKTLFNTTNFHHFHVHSFKNYLFFWMIIKLTLIFSSTPC